MTAALLTPKQEVEKLLDRLPESSTLEDIQYHVYVLEKIKRGQADVDAGRTLTDEEARQRLHKWLQD
jgi:predicted transcriptional regulator